MRFHCRLSVGGWSTRAVGGVHLRRGLAIYTPSLMGMDLPALDYRVVIFPFLALMDRKSGSSFCSREVEGRLLSLPGEGKWVQRSVLD